MKRATNETYAAVENLLNLNPFCQRIFWLVRNSPKYSQLLHCSFFTERVTQMDNSDLANIFRGLYWELTQYEELNMPCGYSLVKHVEIDLSEFREINRENQV